MVKNQPASAGDTGLIPESERSPREENWKPLGILRNSQFSSVAQSCVTLRPHGLQHARLLCPSPFPRANSNSCPLSQWCNPTISSSATSFSFYLQTFPASGSFPMSQFFLSGGQHIGTSASASVLPMNIQGWFPVGLMGLISLQTKGLSRVFSNTTVGKHQLFDAQPSLWSNSHAVTILNKLKTNLLT